jgi:uncharacterized heparinase superfamily protein
LLDQLVAGRLLALETVLFLLGDGGIVERDPALLRDTLADLLDVELGDTVDNRHHELRAKRQRSGQNHDRAP